MHLSYGVCRLRARLHLKTLSSLLKVLANEDTLLPTQMFPRLPARATFVADTNFVSGTQKCFWFCSETFCVRNKCFPVCARKETSWATMCPQQCVLVCQYLKIRGLTIAGCHFCFYSCAHFCFSWEIVLKITFLWKRIRWLMSEIVFTSSISSQTWGCDVLGCKNPCGKSLTSRTWSSRTMDYYPMAVQTCTWRQSTDHVIS